MRFITNFSANQLPIYKKAIRMYSELDKSRVLTIKTSATDCGGRELDGDLSLHVEYKGDVFDLSDFWAVFEVVKNKHRDIYDGTVVAPAYI